MTAKDDYDLLVTTHSDGLARRDVDDILPTSRGPKAIAMVIFTLRRCVESSNTHRTVTRVRQRLEQQSRKHERKEQEEEEDGSASTQTSSGQSSCCSLSLPRSVSQGGDDKRLTINSPSEILVAADEHKDQKKSTQKFGKHTVVPYTTDRSWQKC